MPWSQADATRHTKKAKSAKAKRQWSHVANRALRSGASEGSAVRQANAVVARGRPGSTKSKRGKRPGSSSRRRRARR